MTEGTQGLPRNTACGLSYLAGFVTGAIFFVLDRRPEVRFRDLAEQQAHPTP